jgi:hypothetical protein
LKSLIYYAFVHGPLVVVSSIEYIPLHNASTGGM